MGLRTRGWVTLWLGRVGKMLWHSHPALPVPKRGLSLIKAPGSCFQAIRLREICHPCHKRKKQHVDFQTQSFFLLNQYKWALQHSCPISCCFPSSLAVVAFACFLGMLKNVPYSNELSGFTKRKKILIFLSWLILDYSSKKTNLGNWACGHWWRERRRPSFSNKLKSPRMLWRPVGLVAFSEVTWCRRCAWNLLPVSLSVLRVLPALLTRLPE